MGINTGSKGNGGSYGGKGRKSPRTLPTTTQGRLRNRPVENPFPQEEALAFGTYRVLEVKDDYLVCRGYDPNPKTPFGIITPSAQRTIDVAKPQLLQKTPWDGVDPVEIDGIEYTYEYSTTETGVRTAFWTDADGDHEEEQRIDPPYFVGDILLAAQVRMTPVTFGMDVNDVTPTNENDATLTWVDFNNCARRWDTRSSTDAPIECVDRSEIHQYTIIGSPTGGTFTLTYRINGVAQILTFNWDDTSSEVQTTIETHSEVSPGDVSVTGGPFPNSTIEVVFEGNLAGTAIQLPTADWQSLTGGDGKAAIGTRVQSGYPN